MSTEETKEAADYCDVCSSAPCMGPTLCPQARSDLQHAAIDWKARAEAAEAKVRDLESNARKQAEYRTSAEAGLRGRISELDAQVAELKPYVFFRKEADCMADEIDLLVRRKVIDSRSTAADALLSFRSGKPQSERSDRLLALEAELAKLKHREPVKLDEQGVGLAKANKAEADRLFADGMIHAHGGNASFDTLIAPANGNPVDGWHAGACASRAKSFLHRALKEAAKWKIDSEKLAQLIPLVGKATEQLRCVNDGFDTEFDVERAPEGWCHAGDCTYCQICRLLPEFKCKCGKHFLSRNCPSLWVQPISHQPDKCEEPPKPPLCPHCEEALPANKSYLGKKP